MTLPSPPLVIQMEKGKKGQHLDEMALTPSQLQGGSVQTRIYSTLHSLHGLINLQVGLTKCKVSIVVENAPISNLLENGGNSNPMSVSAFDFVKKVSVHLKPFLSLSIFFAKRCWVVVLNVDFFFS